MAIPTGDVKWSDIYTVINKTPHNGSTSINIGTYVGNVWSDGTAVPSKDISIGTHFRGKSMPPTVPPGYPGNATEINPGDIIKLDSNNHTRNFYISDNFVKNPSNQFIFTDANPDSNYDSRSSFNFTFYSPAGLTFYIHDNLGAGINNVYYRFEEFAYSLYDRLGFQVNNTPAEGSETLFNFQSTPEASPRMPVQWLNKSIASKIPWDENFPGGRYDSNSSKYGWMIPASSSFGRVLNGGIYPDKMGIAFRVIRFHFESDGSSNEQGWRFIVKAFQPGDDTIKQDGGGGKPGEFER